MYTVANVEKFFSDQTLKGDWIVKQEIIQTILDRARRSADENGVLRSGGMQDVFADVGLVASFCHAISRDSTHADIALPAIRRSSS